MSSVGLYPWHLDRAARLKFLGGDLISGDGPDPAKSDEFWKCVLRGESGRYETPPVLGVYYVHLPFDTDPVAVLAVARAMHQAASGEVPQLEEERP